MNLMPKRDPQDPTLATTAVAMTPALVLVDPSASKFTDKVTSELEAAGYVPIVRHLSESTLRELMQVDWKNTKLYGCNGPTILVGGTFEHVESPAGYLTLLRKIDDAEIDLGVFLFHRFSKPLGSVEFDVRLKFAQLDESSDNTRVVYFGGGKELEQVLPLHIKDVNANYRFNRLVRKGATIGFSYARTIANRKSIIRRVAKCAAENDFNISELRCVVDSGIALLLFSGTFRLGTPIDRALHARDSLLGLFEALPMDLHVCPTAQEKRTWNRPGKSVKRKLFLRTPHVVGRLAPVCDELAFHGAEILDCEVRSKYWQNSTQQEISVICDVSLLSGSQRSTLWKAVRSHREWTDVQISAYGARSGLAKGELGVVEKL